jgi:hypothetical protein
MFRHQPRTKTVYFQGKAQTIYCRSDGIPDYTGYKITYHSGDYQTPTYCAVEVKEAHGDSMPASRLKKEQRDWLKNINSASSFVGIFWVDLPSSFELFEFKYQGKYKKSTGILKMDI